MSWHYQRNLAHIKYPNELNLEFSDGSFWPLRARWGVGRVACCRAEQIRVHTILSTSSHSGTPRASQHSPPQKTQRDKPTYFLNLTYTTDACFAGLQQKPGFTQRATNNKRHGCMAMWPYMHHRRLAPTPLMVWYRISGVRRRLPF